MIREGVNYLNNEELLAILLRTGTRKYPVKQLAQLVLKEVGSTEHWKDIPYEQLRKIEGIGPAHACSILAAIEFGRRIYAPVSTLQQLKITGTQTVYEYYKYRLGDVKQEYFYCVYLDQQKKVIRDKQLFVGTVNRSLVHPREIFKEAYLLSASFLICIHNHPSGNVEPSEEDIRMTEQLFEIGMILGIMVLDHMIIGKYGYYSFYENGRISLSK